MTTTTVNGYIIDGGRGGGGWASLSLSRGWEDHRGEGRGSNYGNVGINVIRKRVLRGGTREGGEGGYNDSPTSLRYPADSVVFTNGG